MSSGLKWVLVLLLLWWGWRWWHGPVTTPPGVLVREAPVQRATQRPAFEYAGARLTPRAEFELRARVLGNERYLLDAGSRYSPLDLALGWGPMSDQALLDQLGVSQGARWFHVRWREPPLEVEQIFRHAANMHMLPAEPWVEKALKSARVGQVVQLRGLLVDLDGPEGFTWRSSLSREDTGGGSCELVWVEYVELEEPE